MSTLSVIIITKNEAENIADCLKSVAFASQKIVFDSGSLDETRSIAQALGAQVTHTQDWPGYGKQKNRALDTATGEWILCLDADERLSPALAEEIQQVIQNTDYSAFDIPYQSVYCGKAIRFGDWLSESHIRLFKKGLGEFSNDIVHCKIKVNGSIGKLKNKIIHYPFRNFEKVLYKLNLYSSEGALRLFNQGRKSSLMTAVTHGAWAFIRGYFIKLGFLDGKMGFLLAMSNAQGTYYRYIKLYYMHLQHAA